MIKIGDFSRICQVPVSALRYYAELGLLPPAEVDQFTGYRRYTLDQLPRLYRILALRDLGLSLEQIGLLLREELPPEEIRGMLRLRRAELQGRIEEERARLARVESRLHQIEQEGAMSSYDVVLKEVPAQLVASIRAVIPTYSAVGPLFTTLYSYLARHGVAGTAACIWHDDSYKEQDVDAEVVAYLSEALPADELVRLYTLPATTVASVIHHGAFSGFGAAYAAIESWIQANGYQHSGPAREVYLSMPGDVASPANITEIQLPVGRV